MLFSYNIENSSVSPALLGQYLINVFRSSVQKYLELGTAALGRRAKLSERRSIALSSSSSKVWENRKPLEIRVKKERMVIMRLFVNSLLF